MRCVNELQITTLIVTGKGVYRVDFGDPRSEGGGAGGGGLTYILVSTRLLKDGLY